MTYGPNTATVRVIPLPPIKKIIKKAQPPENMPPLNSPVPLISGGSYPELAVAYLLKQNKSEMFFVQFNQVNSIPIFL